MSLISLFIDVSEVLFGCPILVLRVLLVLPLPFVLVVLHDAKYIKGMINKPDIQPNAAINRWIAAILLFDFRLVHIPGDRHSGPDGLSRQPHTDNGDNENSDDIEEWIDLAGGFTITMENPFPCRSSPAIAPGPIAGDRRDPLIFSTLFSS
jgi:hypothetical protein